MSTAKFDFAWSSNGTTSKKYRKGQVLEGAVLAWAKENGYAESKPVRQKKRARNEQ